MGGPEDHKGEDEQNEGGVADPEDELQHEAHQEELGKGAHRTPRQIALQAQDH